MSDREQFIAGWCAWIGGVNYPALLKHDAPAQRLAGFVEVARRNAAGMTPDPDRAIEEAGEAFDAL